MAIINLNNMCDQQYSQHRAKKWHCISILSLLFLMLLGCKEPIPKLDVSLDERSCLHKEDSDTLQSLSILLLLGSELTRQNVKIGSDLADCDTWMVPAASGTCVKSF